MRAGQAIEEVLLLSLNSNLVYIVRLRSRTPHLLHTSCLEWEKGARQSSKSVSEHVLCMAKLR